MWTIKQPCKQARAAPILLYPTLYVSKTTYCHNSWSRIHVTNGCIRIITTTHALDHHVLCEGHINSTKSVLWLNIVSQQKKKKKNCTEPKYNNAYRQCTMCYYHIDLSHNYIYTNSTILVDRLIHNTGNILMWCVNTKIIHFNFWRWVQCWRPSARDWAPASPILLLLNLYMNKY